MVYEAKALKFGKGDLQGISEKTIENHYEKLYKGYVTKYNEVVGKLEAADKVSANQSFSDLRGLHDGETFTLNAIILHEMYFDNLSGKGSLEGLEIEEAINDQFGSIEGFKDLLVASGMAARGWVVVAINPLDGKIRFYQCDAHNQGGIWKAVPILILDVYEHAYFIDYGSDRKSYLEVFWQNIDWSVVNDRFGSVKP